jgi:hypothetical protein
MKRYFYFLPSLLFLLVLSSCRKDFEFSPSTGRLTFSKDTVYLDTVFSNIGSSTYQLKVYNRSNENIVVPVVKLGLGEASHYRLNVDGMAGKVFENVEILAKDSLFIFIETTVDINNLPSLDGTFLYTDHIEFDTSTKLQKVALVTLVQDAYFIYPNRDNTTKIIETLTLNVGGQAVETNIQGRELLPSELTFTNDKPYVIYGYAAVPNGETLTIDAGARVYFHDNSGLIVTEGATLNINGALSTDQTTLENEVILEGDRLEPFFSNIPGQWGYIWLMDGSINNTINYTTIKNASVGILVDGNPNGATDKLTITNSQIYNSSNFGILGRNTSIKAENVVINNSGQSSFAGTLGGKYNVTHSTIANYWTSSSSRQFPALLLNNSAIDGDGNWILADLTEANFNNCIIYGNTNPEMLLDAVEDASVDFNFKFTNCLIRFQKNNNNFTGSHYDFTDTAHYENTLFNLNPDFKNPSKNYLMIGENSTAINQGDALFASQVPNDILNISRTASPDLGAYQHITFVEED